MKARILYFCIVMLFSIVGTTIASTHETTSNNIVGQGSFNPDDGTIQTIVVHSQVYAESLAFAIAFNVRCEKASGSWVVKFDVFTSEFLEHAKRSSEYNKGYFDARVSGENYFRIAILGGV